MTCQDCEQRPATHRIHYKGGGSIVLCTGCTQFDWVSVDLSGNADWLERIEDGELVRWARMAQVTA